MRGLLLSRRILVVALMLVTVMMLGISMSNAQDEAVLVIGHAESTDSYDPARGYTQTTGVVLRATYSTLVTFPDADASAVEPMLATEWSVSDDGLIYTFTLREGVAFSSGNPVTAADVVFSFNRLKNVLGNPAFLAENIASVEAADAQTIVITLTAADPAFLSLLPNSAFSVTDSALIQENGGVAEAGADASDAAEDFLNGSSAGTGPYILESWDPQVRTVMVRNPNYWGEQAYFDRVIIQNIPEAAAQASALEAGDIDLALDLTSDQIQGLEGNADLAIFSGPANIVHFLLMNQNPDIGGIVSNPTVQLAIRYALDYEGYQTLWGGVQPAVNLAVGLAGALPGDMVIQRDLDRARELLVEAGYPDGFEITLSYPDFSFQGVNMNTNAQKIQADLAEVGINVTLNVGDLQTSLEEYRNGQQGFAYWFWGPDILDPSDFLAFLPGGKVATERAQWLPENAPEELIALIDQARVTSDQEARLALYTQLQQWAMQNGPFAPFNQPDIQTVYRADLQGYMWHPQWLLDVSLLSRSM